MVKYLAQGHVGRFLTGLLDQHSETPGYLPPNVNVITVQLKNRIRTITFSWAVLASTAPSMNLRVVAFLQPYSSAVNQKSGRVSFVANIVEVYCRERVASLIGTKGRL